MAIDYLFVYGTLRRDHGGPAALRLAERAKFVGHGSVAGRLYLIDWYPGLIEAENQVDRVLGEIFAFEDAGLLDELDRYEECSPANDETGEYRRVRRTVQLRGAPAWDSGEREAWAYLFNPPVEGLERILSGDFCRHRRKNSDIVDGHRSSI